MGDFPIKKQQNQLNKINAQEKNNFRGIFNLNETLKSFSSTRPRTIRQFNMAAIFQWLELLFRRINSFLVSIMGD